MSCAPAPVALRLWHDTQVRYGDQVTYAGIVASAQHSADCHRSGHNCASTCGGQESAIDGKGYDPNFAHALDIHINDVSSGLGEIILALLLADPRVRYVIWKGVGHYGIAHGFPGTFDSFDHEDHLHVSFMPGTTQDTQPFYLTGEDLDIMDKATKDYFDEQFENITTRDSAIQHALDDEQDGVIQKTRRLVMEALFLPRKADGTPDLTDASNELKNYIDAHHLAS